MRFTTVLLLIALSGFSFFTRAQSTWPESLILTPERSNFIKTSSHADVISFVDAISKLSPNIHVISMGKSPEGKDIPVAVLASPLVRTPEEAKASGKPVIYIQGNIHAGEVEGKEAVMMLMREILLGNKKNLLDNQIVLFAPIYNTDSNDKMEKGRRPSQEDSPLEVGIRENSQGLDLNRDGIKMEARETQGLFTSIILPWDPQVFVDLHTTNGTWHAWSLTWAPSYHYAGEAVTSDYTNDVMLKQITKTARERYGLSMGPYGDYEVSEGWPVKKFYTYNHHPRYLVNQFSLRNRMAILSEAFSHERFYQRVHSTYTFASGILDYTNTHTKEIVTINRKAEEAAISNVKENAGKVKKGVRFRMDSATTLNRFPTYDYVGMKKADGTTEWLRTGNIVHYDGVTYYAKFTPQVEATLPRGYVIPAEFAVIAEHLKKHGVQVQQLPASRTFKGDVFTVTALQRAQRKFEGHFLATATGTFAPATKKFRKGDYVVDLAQPLANLIFYMMEPQSDDGLVTWNFFDSYFDKQDLKNKPAAYPVFKYYQ
jgi:hypothetical protein